MKQAVAQGGEGEPKLRVLDLASPGWNTLRTYHKRMPGSAVSLKAVDLWPEEIIMSLKDRRIDVTEALKQVDFTRVHGVLPECLKDEPSSYYHHVHFHMFTSDDRVTGNYTLFDDQKTIGMMNEISRIMKGDGLFFFSTDHLFEINSMKGMGHEMQMRFLHKTIGSAFDILGYAITALRSHRCIESGLQPDFKKVLDLFNLDEKPQPLELDYNMLRLYQFISHFSADSDSAEYLAVARKK